ncbi:MAG: hypothetical protein N4A57_09375 [Anaeromicrobium sp.]|uniref:hypothetical protein n=1 Tax=Anaeromicrobium sp. TaxID=1929132 RepID=UPI0025EAC118|nr:hypothetical protein [Anaeromicrobium sp.]MCT4594463.1 hypothetical protein [Anaeromicrobium sp.]
MNSFMDEFLRDVEAKLKEKGLSKKILAEQMGKKYPTLLSMLNRQGIDCNSFVHICYLLDINMNKYKRLFKYSDNTITEVIDSICYFGKDNWSKNKYGISQFNQFNQEKIEGIDISDRIKIGYHIAWISDSGRDRSEAERYIDDIRYKKIDRYVLVGIIIYILHFRSYDSGNFYFKTERLELFKEILFNLIKNNKLQEKIDFLNVLFEETEKLYNKKSDTYDGHNNKLSRLYNSFKKGHVESNNYVFFMEIFENVLKKETHKDVIVAIERYYFLLDSIIKKDA